MELSLPFTTRSAAAKRLRPEPVKSLRPEPKTSLVYDSYWRFAAKRQEIYYRRLRAEPAPWTSDKILASHRFTNAFRASDRVSQFLLRHVIYDDDFSSATFADHFTRILLFKLFNRVETWNVLAKDRDIRAATFSAQRCCELLDAQMERDRRVYSAAYIMPAAQQFGRGRKHRGHLLLLEQMLREDLPCRLLGADSLEAAYQLLLGYQGLGPFLAFQYIIDLNYSPLLNFDEMDFVVAGPGAQSGVRKCFTDTGGRTAEELIAWVCERQEQEFARRGLDFGGLFGRPLQLIDCQNLFCEVDKYARIAHPEVEGTTKRTRIKQKFVPKSLATVPRAFFPPKWGLEGQITDFYSADRAPRPGIRMAEAK